MLEWRRVWLVVTVADTKDGRKEQIATTVAELRALLDDARNDELVWHFGFDSRRELVGDPPTACRRGHPYRGGSATAVNPAWVDCPCGGHMVFACRRPGCGDRRVEPEPAYDCTSRLDHDGRLDSDHQR